MKTVIRAASADGSSVAQIITCRDSGLSDDERHIRDIRERWERQEADARRLRGRLCLAGGGILLALVALMLAVPLGYAIAAF